MPIELHIIRASEFICVDAGEQLDFEESKKALMGLAIACQRRGLDRAMIDLRDLHVPDQRRFTNAELAALVGAFREAGCSRNLRLAVLYRRDVYGDLRNFTFFSRMRGLQVQAFHNFESAIHWLWKETEPLEPKHGEEVPILRHHAKRRESDLAGKIHSHATPHRSAG